MLSNFQLFWFGMDSVWNIFELKDQSVTEDMSMDRGDRRTVQATPGLLIIYWYDEQRLLRVIFHVRSGHTG